MLIFNLKVTRNVHQILYSIFPGDYANQGYHDQKLKFKIGCQGNIFTFLFSVFKYKNFLHFPQTLFINFWSAKKQFEHFIAFSNKNSSL